MSAISAQLRFVEQTGTGVYRRIRRTLGLPAVPPRVGTDVERPVEPAVAAQPRATTPNAVQTAGWAPARASTGSAERRHAFTLTIQILPLVVFVALAIVLVAWIPELQRS